MKQQFDNRRTLLKEGQVVAFNISGQVALGVLEKITASRRYYGTGATFHVRLVHNAAGKQPGHVSKITNPQNLIALVPHEPN